MPYTVLITTAPHCFSEQSKMVGNGRVMSRMTGTRDGNRSIERLMGQNLDALRWP